MASRQLDWTRREVMKAAEHVETAAIGEDLSLLAGAWDAMNVQTWTLRAMHHGGWTTRHARMQVTH